MLANAITATRVAASVAILTCSPVDPVFWFLYAWCGISDIVDGSIARRLGEGSALGARLDSAADLAFAIACCLSLLAECNLATWLIVAIAFLAIAKVLLYALAGGRVRDVHSRENKASVSGMTISQVQGCGKQHGWKEYFRGTEVLLNMVPKVKFEIVATDLPYVLH